MLRIQSIRSHVTLNRDKFYLNFLLTTWNYLANGVVFCRYNAVHDADNLTDRY
jgi:hypothetical protein